MNAQIYNPLCAAIFCQQYPDLVQKIVTTHPEYFIDGNILRISYLEASKYGSVASVKIVVKPTRILDFRYYDAMSILKFSKA